MSLNNIHMKFENILTNEIRAGIVNLSNQTPKHNWINNVLGNNSNSIMKRLERINTWEEYMESCEKESVQLYGSTKNTDLTVLAGYFKSGMRLTVAGKELNYNNSKGSRAAAVKFRLKRMNTSSPFLVIEPFIYKNIIPRQTICNALLGRVNKNALRSEIFKFYAKWYVNSALEYFKGSVKKTAKHLEVSVETIKYWSTREVGNVLINR